MTNEGFSYAFFIIHPLFTEINGFLLAFTFENHCIEKWKPFVVTAMLRQHYLTYIINGFEKTAYAST